MSQLINTMELLRRAFPLEDVTALTNTARRLRALRLRRRYGINAIKMAPQEFAYDLREVKAKLPQRIIIPRT